MTNIETIALTAAVGAEVRGLDLTAPLDPGAIEVLYAALLEHLVVVMHDTSAGPADLVAIASALGPLGARHPIYDTIDGFPDVVELDWHGDHEPDAAEWHTDMRFSANPPFASVLQAIILPPVGGDTLWASMYAAYDALSTGLRNDLAELDAVHDMGSFRRGFVQEGGAARLDQAMVEVGSAVHPVIDHHPVTGRPYLNVNESFTTYLVGLSMPDSSRLLSYLFGHISKPEFHVRLKWQPGTVAVWDNRASQHYAVNDYLPQRRVMHRVVVATDGRLPG